MTSPTPYEVQTWVNGEGGHTPIDADSLNHIETGIKAVDTLLGQWQQQLAQQGTSLVEVITQALAAVSDNGGSVINITDAGQTGTQALRINVPGGDRTTNLTPDTIAVYYGGKRVGYFNEYGELRVIASDDGRVGLRVKQHSNQHSANLIEVTNLGNGILFSVAANGKVTAPNIDRRVSYGSSQPSNPQVGDLWIQP